jgi:hypothetical protein
MSFKFDPDNDPNEAYDVRPADVPPGWLRMGAYGEK